MRVAGLTLEIVEGPGAGRQIPLDREITIGRATDSDVILDDGEVSAHHVKVTPTADGGVTVEDLGSVHGTFINHNELTVPSHLEVGDELLVGVTVMLLRTTEEVAAQPTVIRTVPPALATSVRSPTYVNPEIVAAEVGTASEGAGHQPQLERYLDVRVRRRAQLAPLAVLLLIALALMIYFATR
jgi:pSer/pThr/pTyr-binding forkhead associated (FHA) protein